MSRFEGGGDHTGRQTTAYTFGNPSADYWLTSFHFQRTVGDIDMRDVETSDESNGQHGVAERTAILRAYL